MDDGTKTRKAEKADTTFANGCVAGIGETVRASSKVPEIQRMRSKKFDRCGTDAN